MNLAWAQMLPAAVELALACYVMLPHSTIDMELVFLCVYISHMNV